MENKQIDSKQIAAHSFSLKDRKQLEMEGVKEVVTFNEGKVILQTTQGVMEIKGKDLNMQKLNLEDGQIKIEGYFFSLLYTEKTPDSNLLTRLFK